MKHLLYSFISLFFTGLCLAQEVHTEKIPGALDQTPPSLKNAPTSSQTAEWLFDHQEYVMAKNAANNIVSKSTSSPEQVAGAMLVLVKVAQKEGKNMEALVLLQTWANKFPADVRLPEVNFQIAKLYRELKAYDRAREYFYSTLNSLLALAARVDDADSAKNKRLAQAATWEIAETDYSAGNWQRAFELFERFKKQNANVLDLVQASLYRQADCTYQLGKLHEAIDRYQTALAVGPFHPFAPEAWLRLVELYGREKDAQKQAKALESFIWIVRQSHAEEVAYWQRRCASVLVQFVKDQPKEVQTLVGTLESVKQRDDGWASLRIFFQLLASRMGLPNSVKLVDDKDWSDWRQKMDASQDHVREKFDSLKLQN